MSSLDTPSDVQSDASDNQELRSRQAGSEPRRRKSADGERKRPPRGRSPNARFLKHCTLEDLRDRLRHALEYFMWEIEKSLSECNPVNCQLASFFQPYTVLGRIYQEYERVARAKVIERRANRILGSTVLPNNASEREAALFKQNLSLQAKTIQLSTELRKVRARVSRYDSDYQPTDRSESESDDNDEIEPASEAGEGSVKSNGITEAPSRLLKNKVKRWRTITDRFGDDTVVGETQGAAYVKLSASRNAIEHFRTTDKQNKYLGSTVKIWSKPLIELLESVIERYPGNETQYPHDGSLTMKEPYLVLFAFREQIEEAIATAKGSAAAHGRLLMDLVMKETMEAAAMKHVEIEKRLCKDITFKEMWLLYTPGAIIYTKEQDQWRAYRVEQILGDNIRSSPDRKKKSGEYFVNCSFAAFNEKGTELQRCANSFKLIPFAGIEKIRDLKYIPAAFMENEEEIRANLIERGQMYWSYRDKSHHKEYTGDAWPSFEEHKSMRVIVDYATTSRSKKAKRKAGSDSNADSDDDRDYKREVIPIPETYGEKADEAYLFCPSHVDAYSLKEKDWREVALRDLRPVQFNEAAFKSLIIDKTYKQTVSAMASSHLRKFAISHDIIQGKGKSLVILLHGSPGTGKTLTAECVAERTERPLYMVTSGDLGTKADDLEMKLRRTFEFAANWNAVLLLDEADVFLQERDVTYLDRNALVSVFLRELEYFQGIIFLTTNRPGALDEAFQSRIHITLWLPDLNQDSRIRIWALFVKELPIPKISMQRLLADIETQLGKVSLNGRQIRNCMQAARALAQQKDEEIGIKHVKDVVEIGQKFTSYMKEVNRMGLEQKALALGMRLSQPAVE